MLNNEDSFRYFATSGAISYKSHQYCSCNVKIHGQIWEMPALSGCGILGPVFTPQVRLVPCSPLLPYVSGWKLGQTDLIHTVILLFLRFKGKVLDVYCTFLPQMIFLQCLIGYLVFMIFFKWFACDARTVQPSLLICLINMFLQFGSPIDPEMALYNYQVFSF